MSTQPNLRELVRLPNTPASQRRDAAAALVEEQQWIARAKEGDRAAWDHLYQANYDVVLRRVRFLCGRLALAEELTQDAFLQAIVNIDKFDGRASFRTWLRSVALNIVRNHWRSQRSKAAAHAKLRVVQELVATPSGTDPDRALEQQQRSDALYRALALLPENLREVFVLRDIEGLDREAIAQALGITTNNVSVRCTRARQRLQEVLAELGCLDPAPGGHDV